jgi:hypothetical protein
MGMGQWRRRHAKRAYCALKHRLNPNRPALYAPSMLGRERAAPVGGNHQSITTNGSFEAEPPQLPAPQPQRPSSHYYDLTGGGSSPKIGV